MSLQNAISNIVGALGHLYTATKATLPVASDRPVNIALIGISSDAKHFGLAIDAFGSNFIIFTDDPAHLAAQEDLAGPTRADLRHYRSFLKRPPRPWDLIVLLHPRPFVNADNMARLRPLARAFRLGTLLHPLTPAVMYHRDLELWKASPGASLARRFLLILNKTPLAILLRREARTLREKVFPFLPQAHSWNRPGLCAHEKKIILFNDHRPLEFCPECGMGLTPRASLSRLDDASKCYGAGYAAYGRFTGMDEFMRSVHEENGRVNGYLECMGFPGSLALADRQGKARVLDYGCGNGRMLALWHARGCDYLGVDYSPANIEYARELARIILPENNTKAEFICGTIDNILTENKQIFPIIFLSHVLEHVKDPARLLGDLRRMATPGAFIYVEVPNAFSYTWNMAHRGYANREHLWDFTPAMLERIAAAAGGSAPRIHLDPAQDRYPYMALLARNRLADDSGPRP